MSKLKAGVIGAGVFGAHHARKYQMDERVELVGVYDLDAERTEAVADAFGVRTFANMDDLLDLLDVVTIASPPMTHASAAAAALEYGKHVLIEKPIATSRFEAGLLVDLARDKNLVLACGHQERLVFEAMGLYAAHEKPTLIESVREGPWTGRSADVSVTLDLMVHDLDLVLQLMGEQPHQIAATAKCEHGRTADAIEAHLAFGAAEAVFTSSRIAPERNRSPARVQKGGRQGRRGQQQQPGANGRYACGTTSERHHCRLASTSMHQCKDFLVGAAFTVGRTFLQPAEGDRPSLALRP